jgi:hypothetical protein
MKKEKNRENWKLRLKISELRDIFKPVSSISYKATEIAKIYNVYGDNNLELENAFKKYLELLNKFLAYSEEVRSKIGGENEN